jgi:hypothetical protein
MTSHTHTNSSTKKKYNRRNKDWNGFFALDSSSWILHPGLFILDPSSWILRPGLFILDSSSWTLHPGLFILDSSSGTLPLDE